ncbi:phosphate ABC transporter substrate-binding protein [Zoogloea ramigera]|uniref:Phosphate ABC transporter substrate-binding protein n=1 Tax=Zoogloea ramigera TaxID=350 RepID=A0A4Y4CUM5_ZOORA|nr:phosphate/phosphite/phosphonate ABC transporter substrate-binding protein [Zoogloea ramigera]GEC96598.1 phosphate ABC transporter substrate-binding protein [Zoogloea ramigera]
MRTPLRSLLRPVFGLVLLLATLKAAVAAPPTYSVAIVPQFSAQQIHAEWQPLLKRVGDEAGVKLEMRFPSTIPTFETSFLQGEPDFIFGNPYHAVMARRKQGYIPLVRDEKLLTGILVVAKDGPVSSLKHLAGQKIAFPAPNAFGASLYMRALLIEKEQLRIEPVYVKTHGNVYRQVLVGDFVAGGGVNQTFADLPAVMRDKLQVLYETPGAAPHPFAAHPRVPDGVRKRITAAFLKQASDAEGKALLKDVRMPNPVAADYGRDYGPLEKLRLDKYLVLEE